MTRLFMLLCLSLSLGSVWATPLRVQDVHLSTDAEHGRVVLELTGAPTYKVFSLPTPDRLVIDLSNAHLAQPPRPQESTGGMITGLRSAPRNGQDLRIVVDLKALARYRTSVVTPNNGQQGYRLVVDIEGIATAAQQIHQAQQEAPPPPAPETPAAKPPVSEPPAAVAPPQPAPGPETRDIIVAIDAGHGGEDPGAKGYSGTFEKDIVLAVARDLNELIQTERGMRPVLIRDGDYFLPLRERTKKARDQKADIFVSIHADAYNDSTAQGSSVFVLSERGATSEAARWLAESENAADLVGGVKLDGKDEVLASVLLDLSQTATISASMNAASGVMDRLKRVGRAHRGHVEQAGFVVLKSPDIPSMLVETAFISNPDEERKLLDPDHQETLARAILDGIRDYFRKNPPPGTRFAMREHIVAKGETLAAIAQRYGVSVRALRRSNSLRADNVPVGGVLRIPPGKDS